MHKYFNLRILSFLKKKLKVTPTYLSSTVNGRIDHHVTSEDKKSARSTIKLSSSCANTPGLVQTKFFLIKRKRNQY